MWRPGLSLRRLAACTLLLAHLAACQQPSPLKGRGFPPANGTDVYVSCIIDRLTSVDDVNYRFEAMLYFELSWRDPRAQPLFRNATQAAKDPSYNNGDGCRFPCSSLYDWTPGAPCCDGIFLPSLEFVNARGFSQDRPDRWRVVVNTDEGNDAVVWWSYVLGEWYTPMQFQAFPFDKQLLVVQMQYGNRNTSVPVRFIPSSTSLELNRRNTGDDVSGWHINSLDIYPFNHTNYQDALIRESGATHSAPGDPWPLNPVNNSVQAFTSQLWSEGVDVVIEVERISVYYVIVAILPIAVNVWLCLLIFFINPKHLDTRLGVVVTMFLSLTAIQYVINSVLPSSSTVVPTQQLVITSYVVLGIIGLFSILVYFIVTADRNRAKREQRRQASHAFTRRWTTLVRGVGSAASGGVEAAAAAAVAANPRPASQPTLSSAPLEAGQPDEGSRSAGRGKGARSALRQATMGRRQSSVSFSTQQSDTDWEPLEKEQRGRRGELEGGSSARFGGMGMCAVGADSPSDSEAEQAKEYQSSDSESDAPAPETQRSSGSVLAATAAAVAAVPAAAAAAAVGLKERVLRSGPESNGAAGWAAAGSSGPERDIEACTATQGRGQPDGSKGSGGNAGGERSKVHGRHGSWHKRCLLVCSGGWWEEQAKRPGRWLWLQRLKLKEMVREAQENKEYAEHLAAKTDRCVFWFVLLGYNIALVVIFAVGAQQQPQVVFLDVST